MANESADACPVDHKTRDAWLAQARAAEASKAQSDAPSSSQPASCPVDHSSSASSTSRSWTQSLASYLPWSSSSSAPSQPSSASSRPQADPLDTDRIISSIPRSNSNPEACPVDHGSSANAEVETGKHASGNWVYPSEKMFFEAMKRKGYNARVADMKTVVPIHNAVNERAWEQIKKWEAPYLENSKFVSPRPSLPLSGARRQLENIVC